MSSENDTISVLIVDDHPIVRQGLHQLLEIQDGIEVVGEADGGKAAVKLVAELLPDVVLMDLIMGEMSGIDATREVRKISPHTKVVVLTSYHEDALIFPAIKAGALSYLLKNSLPEDVVDAVRAAARREARLHSRIAGRLMQEVAGTRPSVDVLTARELEVLKLIASGMSNKEIATTLHVSHKTVKTHVSNLLSKLQLSDRTQAAVYALRQRLVPLDE